MIAIEPGYFFTISSRPIFFRYLPDRPIKFAHGERTGFLFGAMARISSPQKDRPIDRSTFGNGAVPAGKISRDYIPVG